MPCTGDHHSDGCGVAEQGAVEALGVMAAKRRRKASQGEIEEKALAIGRWSWLKQLAELEARNHSQQENCTARRQCREFLEGWLGLD
uniref:hypothetical protein n=1 Tax=Synechococcus sp. UW106 TaxID=368495 RepID=UPI000E0F4B69|nr:hypothetical protein [Synechococcus sp. UW106]